jgi:hypothetical protein
MGLAELQGALAHLYTDAAARDQLRADRAAFALRHGLSAEEAQALAQDVLDDAQYFAASLFRKRRDETARAMPLAVETLGPRFHGVFQQFAATHPLGAMRNPALDALAFLEWLPAREFKLSGNERAALRYTRHWLAMQHSARRFLIRVLHVRGHRRYTLSIAVWWRWRGRLHHRVIG